MKQRPEEKINTELFCVHFIFQKLLRNSSGYMMLFTKYFFLKMPKGGVKDLLKYIILFLMTTKTVMLTFADF